MVFGRQRGSAVDIATDDRQHNYLVVESKFLKRLRFLSCQVQPELPLLIASKIAIKVCGEPVKIKTASR